MVKGLRFIDEGKCIAIVLMNKDDVLWFGKTEEKAIDWATENHIVINRWENRRFVDDGEYND